MIDKRSYPGNYKINNLLLVTDNNVFDLRNVFLEIHLYEDLFAPVYSGNILVTETDNLTGNYKILGGERIILDFESETEIEGSVENIRTSIVGIVVKIDNEQIVTGGQGKSYVIDFISEDMILNMKKKISQSFLNKPLHHIVNFALNELETRANRKIEETKTVIERVIIPNWNPFKTINWCAERAVQTASRISTSLSTFLFYQTLYNTEDYRNRENSSFFHFVSIDSLLKKEPKKEVFFNIRETYSYKIDPRKFLMADNFEVVTSFDYLKGGLEGAYSSRMYQLSFKNKSWKQTEFDYKDQFNILMDHMEKNPMINTLTEFIKNPEYTTGTKTPQVFFMTLEESSPFNFSRTVRNSQLSFLNNRRIRMVLPGNAFLSVGDVIDFKMQSYEKDKNRDTEGLDRTYSGKYLITAVNHTIKRDKYTISIEAAMESLKQW
ncbi:MAG: hypothetical protein N3A54_00215 [Patescibacteria group bacterium]|nr:hypothetical protein [Patescibacteria group bacterium]